jgi:hypothetical protein
MKLLRMLRLVFSPFKEIAKELKIIRELYEAELSERQPPIIRLTEAPNPRFDTEVFGMDGESEKPAWRRFLAFDKPEEDPEDDQRDL